MQNEFYWRLQDFSPAHPQAPKKFWLWRKYGLCRRCWRIKTPPRSGGHRPHQKPRGFFPAGWPPKIRTTLQAAARVLSSRFQGHFAGLRATTSERIARDLHTTFNTGAKARSTTHMAFPAECETQQKCSSRNIRSEEHTSELQSRQYL